jgi:hypothetical protein
LINIRPDAPAYQFSFFLNSVKGAAVHTGSALQALVGINDKRTLKLAGNGLGRTNFAALGAAFAQFRINVINI